MVRAARFALAGVRVRIELCALETLFALESSSVPKLFFRALVAVAIDEEGEVGRTGLT